MNATAARKLEAKQLVPIFVFILWAMLFLGMHFVMDKFEHPSRSDDPKWRTISYERPHVEEIARRLKRLME